MTHTLGSPRSGALTKRGSSRDDLDARRGTLTTTLAVQGDLHALRTVVDCLS